jgi:PEP-CTERM motif
MTHTLRNFGRSIAVLAIAALALALPAAADTFNFTLANSVVSGAPGDTISFDASVNAPLTNTGTLYLVGDSSTLNIVGATIDDSPFLLNFPLFLNPGDSYTGDLFNVILPASVAPGLYSGFFEIQGGSTSYSQDILGSVAFSVNVTPEPSTWMLLGTGVLLGTFALSRRHLVPGSLGS